VRERWKVKWLVTVRVRMAEGPKNLPRFLLSLRLIDTPESVTLRERERWKVKWLVTVRVRTAEGPKNLPRFLLSLRLINASKTVGPPDGKYEREKDRR
jgi:hypothetical protein